MRLVAITREAWRNVAAGTARSGLKVTAVLVLVFGAQALDCHDVAQLVARTTDFRETQADVTTISASGLINGARCDALVHAPSVTNAGALAVHDDLRAASAPGTSIPAFDVTPGFARLMSGKNVDEGVVVSRSVADLLGVREGDEVPLVGGEKMTVGAIYHYPEDGRRSGFGFGVMIPSAPQAAFDSCWMEEWPQSNTAQTLLRATVNPDLGAQAPTPEMGQLNTGLGRTLDAAGEFDSRIGRWLPAVVMSVSGLVGLVFSSMRRLEYASALHLGVTRKDLVAISSVEWLIELIVFAVLAVLSASASAVIWGDAPLRTWLTLGLGLAVAAPGGSAAGSFVAIAMLRERDVLRLFKER